MIAGVIAAITFFIHLILGQSTLINPMMESDLGTLVKTEFLAVWHMISVILLATAVLYIVYSIKNIPSSVMICLLSNLYLVFGVVFILAGIYNNVFILQWILLLPIGILGLVGIKKHSI